MNKSIQKRFEHFMKIKMLFLSYRKNEDEFLKAWERFKKNPKTSIITNHEDAQFFAECERFTKLIIKTRHANKELDKKWNELVSKKEELEKRDNSK